MAELFWCQHTQYGVKCEFCERPGAIVAGYDFPPSEWQLCMKILERVERIEKMLLDDRKCRVEE